MRERIGFIGLGVMGSPMAVNLAKNGYEIKIFDVDSSKATALAAEGVKIARDVAGIGEESDIVILSLPNSVVVKEVVLGENGLAVNMGKSGVIIDTSTTEPTVSMEIAGVLKDKGIHFLDAPVSGGEKAAIEGTLSFMVGGDMAVFEQCRGVLEAMGSTIVRVGESGMGEVAKAVNQMIVGAAFAVIAESFALGVKSGLDPKVLYEAIRNGWAGSKVLDVSVGDMLGRSFKPGGTVNIHAKDLGYALSLAKDTDVPTPVTALVHEIFKSAKADGKGSLSQSALVMLWERILKMEVKGDN